jgi:class 3 adenylate cyclase
MSRGAVDGELRERRVSAILAADVVGYSKLMGADEVETLSALRRHRRELIDPTITSHRGRGGAEEPVSDTGRVSVGEKVTGIAAPLMHGPLYIARDLRVQSSRYRVNFASSSARSERSRRRSHHMTTPNPIHPTMSGVKRISVENSMSLTLIGRFLPRLQIF